MPESINKTHSTPAGVVVEYFESLRWLAKSAGEANDDNQARRNAALAVIMAVNAVEVFLNLWFRVVATERNGGAQENQFGQDLARRISLEQKLTTWPIRHLQANLDLRHGAGKAFVGLKRVRNSIVHFESSHDTVHTGSAILHGLADTTDYDGLTAASANEALTIAENLVTEIFRLAGFDDATIDHAATVWIGKRPKAESDSVPQRVAPWVRPHVQR
jgi:hypothetical protein